MSLNKMINEEVAMLATQGVRSGLVSRRQALALLAATATVRSTKAAEAGILQPAMLDHVNIRVSNVAQSAEFYTGASHQKGDNNEGYDDSGSFDLCRWRRHTGFQRGG